MDSQNSSWRSQQSSSPLVEVEQRPIESKFDRVEIPNELEQTPTESMFDHVEIPNDGTDVWEIDTRLLKFENKVASGAYGDL